MKKFKINWLKIANCLLLMCVCVYAILFGIKKARDFEIYKQPIIETKIYIVWHIETFEGGSQARINFLNKIARTLEKENPGTLFMVKLVEPEKAKNLLEQEIPDICSFGFGIGKVILPHISELDSTWSVRDELINSGSFNNALYALPYIISGYSLIEQGENTSNFWCGINNYTHPERIYNEIKKTPVELKSQFESYKTFANCKTGSLLGTARDVFRVNNLNKNGRTNATFKAIDSYTDLIQYISLTNKNETTLNFIKQSVSPNFQSTLKDYSLFSSLYNKLYFDGIYNDMENAIFNAKIPNVFND